MSAKFKVGDTVTHEDGDIGTVLKYEHDGYWLIAYKIDGIKIIHEDRNTLRNSPDILGLNEEQQAVMLLLSLGYTISKN